MESVVSDQPVVTRYREHVCGPEKVLVRVD